MAAASKNLAREDDYDALMPSVEEAPLAQLSPMVRDEPTETLIEELAHGIIHEVMGTDTLAITSVDAAGKRKEIGRVRIDVTESTHADGQSCYLVTMGQTIVCQPDIFHREKSKGTPATAKMRPCTMVAFVSPSLVTLRQTCEEQFSEDSHKEEHAQENTLINVWRDANDKGRTVVQCKKNGIVSIQQSIDGTLAACLLFEGAQTVLMRVLTLHGIASGMQVPEAFHFPELMLNVNSHKDGILLVRNAAYVTEPVSRHVYHGRVRALFGICKTCSLDNNTDEEDYNIRQHYQQRYTNERGHLVYSVDGRAKHVQFEAIPRKRSNETHDEHSSSDQNNCTGESDEEEVDLDVDYANDFSLATSFYEHKNKSRMDQEAYLSAHPELQATMDDFLRILLLRKPDDIYKYATEHFAGMQ